MSSHAETIAQDSARVRVRTPGKHIVLFALAVTFMLALSTTLLRSGALPDLSVRADPSGDFRAPPQEFLTDLAPDSTGRIAFMKLKATLVVGDKAALAEIEAAAPAIRERISFFLRELSPEDFAGSERMARLKAELLKRANLPLEGDPVKDVVIEDLVIQ